MYYKKKREGKKGRRSRNKGGGKKRIKIINLGLKSQLSEKNACHVGMIPRSREKSQMLGITLVQKNDSCGSQSVLKKDYRYLKNADSRKHSLPQGRTHLLFCPGPNGQP